ncbi:hypothetical protein BASA60_000718 [Batrachochytrium salamandrivorans]|nr:hypothetical protein BASA60_000718 [Batrachochytrium salamandrivorans]
MGLAEPRTKQRINIDPQNKQWKDDKTKFGHKMLEKMGWSDGKGLGRNEDGRTDNIQVKLMMTVLLIAPLPIDENAAADNVDRDASPKESAPVSAPPQFGRLYHRKKFLRNKQVSNYDSANLSEILGKKHQKEQSTATMISPPTNPDTSNSHIVAPVDTVVVSSLTVQEYFAQRMALLKQAGSTNLVAEHLSVKRKHDEKESDSEDDRPSLGGHDKAVKVDAVKSDVSLKKSKKSDSLSQPSVASDKHTPIDTDLKQSDKKRHTRKIRQEHYSDMLSISFSCNEVPVLLIILFYDGWSVDSKQAASGRSAFNPCTGNLQFPLAGINWHSIWQQRQSHPCGYSRSGESSHSLTEKQLDSIALLKRHCTELPIPTELAAQSPQRQEGASAEPDVLGPTTGIDPPAATAGTVAGKMSEAPHTTAMLTRPDKDSTVGGKPASSPSSSSVLTIAETIETTQQFLAWFAKVEEEMERGQEDVYRACLATVRGYRDATANILINTSHTSALLDDLETNYNFIEEKTKGLQISCETLLDEQTHLIGVTEELSAKLAYFNELDPITRMLNAPGETIVLDEKFGPMLQKLDQCLSFVMQHLHYKDAEIYRMRYRQCMTRSITLVKMHFVNVIRGLQQDIGEKLEGRQTHEPLPMNMQLTLFYVKFRTLASKIKHLLGEIEERCNEHTEYLVLLRDCFTAYFVARRTLLSPFISAHIFKRDTLAEMCQSSTGATARLLAVCNRPELESTGALVPVKFVDRPSRSSCVGEIGRTLSADVLLFRAEPYPKLKNLQKLTTVAHIQSSSVVIASSATWMRSELQSARRSTGERSAVWQVSRFETSLSGEAGLEESASRAGRNAWGLELVIGRS